MEKEKKQPEGYCGHDYREIKNENDRPCCKRCDPDTGKCTAFIKSKQGGASGRGSMGTGKVYKFYDHSGRGIDRSPYEPQGGSKEGDFSAEVGMPEEPSKSLPGEKPLFKKQDEKYRRRRRARNTELDEAEETGNISFSLQEELEGLEVEYESYPAGIVDLENDFEVTFQQPFEETEQLDLVQEEMDLNIQYEHPEIDSSLGNLEVILPEQVEPTFQNIYDPSIEPEDPFDLCDQFEDLTGPDNL